MPRGLGLLLMVTMAVPVVAADPLFVDRAAEAGLDFRHANGARGELYFAEVMGAGAALFDYDGDGDLDAYLVQGGPLEVGKPPGEGAVSRLYRNDLDPASGGGGRLVFTDVTAAAGIPAGGYGMGVATGDYDGDGHVDLYQANFGANRLLRNRGDGTFEDVTARAGVGDGRWSVAATFFDADGDRDLDLYVVNYVDFTLADHRFCPSPLGKRDYCGPSAYRPVPDRLFRNRGDGTFEELPVPTGVGGRPGAGLGVVAEDFDGDGRLDLYVANDGMANNLLLGAGDGTFRDEALLAGVAVNAEGAAEASMGVDAGDMDGDGDPDLFMTHLSDESNTLYVNDGRGLFSDASLASGLATPSWRWTGFGTAFLDYDLDGRLDLVAVNGAVTYFAQGGGDDLGQPDLVFHNAGGGRFAAVPPETAGEPFALREAGRGLAVGDVDDDGDPDLLISTNGGPARLLINQSDTAGRWLGLRLVTADGGAAGERRDALGARVTLERSGRSSSSPVPPVPPLVRRVATDGSYASARDPRVVFGLGDGAAAEADEADEAGTAGGDARVRVRWPDGLVEEWPAPAAGRYTTLERGTGAAGRQPAATVSERSQGVL